MLKIFLERYFNFILKIILVKMDGKIEYVKKMYKIFTFHRYFIVFISISITCFFAFTFSNYYLTIIVHTFTYFFLSSFLQWGTSKFLAVSKNALEVEVRLSVDNKSARAMLLNFSSFYL